ncbi:hypothetical protein JCM12856_10260 [Spirochaeta dissipatitropha]
MTCLTLLPLVSQPQAEPAPSTEEQPSPAESLHPAETESAIPTVPGSPDQAQEADGTHGTFPEEEQHITDSLTPQGILQALQQAYPHRVHRYEIHDGEWRILIGDEWLYYANGRFLPRNMRSQWEQYDPIPFYSYPRTLPEFTPPEGEHRERLQQLLTRRSENPPRRHPGLYNAIWQSYDQRSSYEQVKTIYFLGKQTMVHRDLLSILASIEHEINTLALQDPQIAAYIRSIAGVEGYSYRRVADTASLSFHSYGTAVDIVPSNYHGLSPYWLWASQWNSRWYDMDHSQRYMPPESIIEIFEQHGFIWGGKWLLFDTIHFEYRPEILILNNFRRQEPVIQLHRYQ